MKRWPRWSAAALLAPLAAAAQPAAHFTTWAAQHAVALPPCPPDSKQWEKVGAIVGNVDLVALGEPAHGAQEPLALRNCLFRYLVEHHGFTAIALETGVSESRALDDYVAGDSGDARQLARDNFSWGFGRYAENVALLEWMRGYNADPAHTRKLHLYGIDLSGGDKSGAWRNAAVTLRASIAYLARVMPDRSQPVRKALAPFLDRFSAPGYAAMTAAERSRLRRAIAALIGSLDRHRTDDADWAWARRNAVGARQLERLFRVSRPPTADDELSPDDYKADIARDAAMAENALWASRREAPNGRLLLFAHDGHIMNAATRGGSWSVYRRAPAAMGVHLKAALGARLLIVPIVSPAGPDTDLDTALARTGRDRFLLDLRPVRRDGWLARERSVRTNFTDELLVKPGIAFDALIFLGRLSPAR
ncbi:erythromycin esterase family protein [Sphingomonas lycopersici]|uniref:Erythromycin esterase family protein n=1 Tax=Sphingomonas lycopersici TaxID=2951807 RepID=A0AA41ZDF4_9SPHN|nr:erythromycin esterase family protein [Sphingomonas lycopersici]